MFSETAYEESDIDENKLSHESQVLENAFCKTTFQGI